MAYTVERLFFSYGNAPVVTDLTLALEPGLFYGLLGPNGCGKTTLLDLLVRYRRPEQGRIALYGKPLDRYSGRELSRTVALVAQNPVTHFPYTVKDLVMMGRHPYIGRFSTPTAHDLKTVDEAMDLADVRDFAHAPVTELSGGERQRVMFARALAQDTPVLLLDEATSSLDIRHSLALLDSVRTGVNERGKTVISVFHDINLAALFCDRLLLMSEGRLHSQGTVDDVLNAEAIREVYRVEARVQDEPFSGARQVFFRTGRTDMNRGLLL